MAINYFSHDCNARYDPKMLRLRMKFGWEGYAIFFVILEMMRTREAEEYTLPTDYDALAFELNIDSEELQSIVNDFGLFELTDDGQAFYSNGFRKRMAMVDDLKNKRAMAGRKGGRQRAKNAGQNLKQDEASLSNAQANVKQCLSNAQASLSNKTKLNKTKLNKNNFISEKMTDTVNPTPSQFETPEEAGVQPSQEMIQKRQFFTLNIWSKYPETRRGNFEEAFTQFLSALEDDKPEVIKNGVTEYIKAKQNEPIKYTAMLANNLKRKDYRNDYSAKKQGRKEQLPEWANKNYKPQEINKDDEERLRKENEELLKELEQLGM